MKTFNKIVSATIAFCFIFNAALSDLALSQTVNFRTRTDNLAPASIFGNLQGIEHKDIGRIKVVAASQLFKLFRDIKEPIFIEALRKKSVFEAKENTIFNPAGMYIYLAETQSLKNGLYYTRCRVEQPDALGRLLGLPRTYYIVFANPYGDDYSEIDFFEVYTEKEFKAARSAIENATDIAYRKSHNPKDAEAINRWYWHETSMITSGSRPSVDEFISERIASGAFAEIKKRPSMIKADVKYPARINPYHLWDAEILDALKTLVDSTLGQFDLNLEGALAGKNLVFISVPKDKRYPVISENGRVFEVKAHSSNNAVYIFLPGDQFDMVKPGMDYSEFLRRNAVDRTMLNEVNAIYGLPYVYRENGIAGYLNILHGADNGAQFDHIRDQVRDMLSSNDRKPVNLDENLHNRDYASGVISSPALFVWANSHIIAEQLRLDGFITLSDYETGYNEVRVELGLQAFDSHAIEDLEIMPELGLFEVVNDPATGKPYDEKRYRLTHTGSLETELLRAISYMKNSSVKSPDDKAILSSMALSGKNVFSKGGLFSPDDVVEAYVTLRRSNTHPEIDMPELSGNPRAQMLYILNGMSIISGVELAGSSRTYRLTPAGKSIVEKIMRGKPRNDDDPVLKAIANSDLIGNITGQDRYGNMSPENFGAAYRDLKKDADFDHLNLPDVADYITGCDQMLQRAFDAGYLTVEYTPLFTLTDEGRAMAQALLTAPEDNGAKGVPVSSLGMPAVGRLVDPGNLIQKEAKGNPDEYRATIKPTIDTGRILAFLERSGGITAETSLRGADLGSSMDLGRGAGMKPGLKELVTPREAKRLADVAQTIVIPSKFMAKIKVTVLTAEEKQRYGSDSIVYVSDLHGCPETKPGVYKERIKLVDGKAPRKQADMVGYILWNLYGIHGVKVAFDVYYPGKESDKAYGIIATKAGGMGTSGATNTLLHQVGSILSGAKLTRSDCAAEAIDDENTVAGGYTGGQEGYVATAAEPQDNARAVDLIWISGILDSNGNPKYHPHAALSIPMLTSPEDVAFVEDHAVVLQIGARFEKTASGDIEKVAHRSASCINTGWMHSAETVRDVSGKDNPVDPVGAQFHIQKVQFVRDMRTGLIRRDITLLNRGNMGHVNARNGLSLREAELITMGDPKLNIPPQTARLKDYSISDKIGLATYGLSDEKRRAVEAIALPILEKEKQRLSITAEETEELNALVIGNLKRLLDTKTSLYSDYSKKLYEAIEQEMAQDKELSMSAFNTGAGGDGGIIMLWSSKGIKHIEDFLQRRLGIKRFDPEEVVRVTTQTGGVLAGWMPFEIGQIGTFIKFANISLEEAAAAGFSLPGASSTVAYDENTGRYTAVSQTSQKKALMAEIVRRLAGARLTPEEQFGAVLTIVNAYIPELASKIQSLKSAIGVGNPQAARGIIDETSLSDEEKDIAYMAFFRISDADSLIKNIGIRSPLRVQDINLVSTVIQLRNIIAGELRNGRVNMISTEHPVPAPSFVVRDNSGSEDARAPGEKNWSESLSELAAKGGVYEISFYAARDAQGAPVATILLESAAADKPPVDIEYPASPVLELSDVDIVMRQDKSPDYMPWARAVVDFFEGLKETGQIATTAVEDSLVLGSNYVKDKEEEGYTFLSKGGHSITIGYSKFSGPSADLKISIVNRGFGDKSQFIALPMASLREVRFDKAAQKIVLSVENGARASVYGPRAMKVEMPVNKAVESANTEGVDLLNMEIRTLDKEVEPMIELAREAGIQMAPPSQRYTLIVDRSLYKDDELKNDNAGYDTRVGRIGAADRFDLKAVDTSNVGNILANITDPANTVIQISSELSQTEMDELSAQAPGVRVIRVNTLGFTSDPELNNAARRDARFDLYAMMLLARRVTEKDIAESNSIYRVLSFMIETRIMSGQIAAATDYIKAIATDSLLKVIKTNLSYVPAAKWRTPRYEEVAATLISA